MIRDYDNFLGNLIKENAEPTDEFDTSVISVQKKSDISTKNIRSKYNSKLTNDGQIIDISGTTEYYAIFHFSPVDTGSTTTSGITSGTTTPSTLPISDINNLKIINDSVFKLKIKITASNVVENKIEYTFDIIDFLSMTKYKQLIIKYKGNLSVFGSDIKGNKIHSYFVFTKIDNVKTIVQSTFKKIQQPTNIIE